jgi:phosphoglycerol transferase MdoB-like AlkP superfamily enzyme
MNHFYSQFLLLLKRLLLVLVLFILGRLYFFLHNIQYFAQAWPEEVLKSFFYGLQFDVSAIIYLNLPFILLHLLPGKFVPARIGEGILKCYFFTVNGLLVLANLMDSEYFRFTGKRSTSDFFAYLGAGDDIVNLIPRFIYDYWFILLVWILLIYGAWKLYPENSRNSNKRVFSGLSRIVVHSVAALFATAFLISLARGYRLKPLRVITAANYVSAPNIPLILNTPFTMMKSFKKQQLRVPGYFSMEKAGALFSPLHETKENAERLNTNVVVIIMESFSSEYSGYLRGSTGHMPFLDSLMQHSLHFTNSFANAKKSIEAIPAILASIPVLMETPFVSSPYSANRINSLPGELRELGYHTSFFHGGANGTMNFDDFVRVAGTEHYYGKDEFGNDEFYDGYWGIFDEEFFRFFAGELNTFPQPFFSCFFSLSSHHPYIIPARHKGRFHEDERSIRQSVEYADYSLKKFFEAARNEQWYKNTLFVITADHTTPSHHPWYQNRVGGYSVPVLYYHPGDPGLRGKSDRLTQHIDIMPSVLDYIGAHRRFISFGSSVFSDHKDGFVINYLNGIYQFMENDRVLFYDGEKATGLFNFVNDSLLLENFPDATDPEHGLREIKQLERLQSIIQQYNYMMVNNKMSAD